MPSCELPFELLCKLRSAKMLLLAALVCNPYSLLAANPGENEQLQATPPPGWQQIYQVNNEDMRLIDFVPPTRSEARPGARSKTESPENYDTKLSFEAHRQVNAIDPIQVLSEEVEALKKICSFVSSSNIYSGLENGYPTSVRIIECGENAHYGKGEVSIVKTIQGQTFFYFVRFTRRIKPFAVGEAKFDARSLAKWSTYLKQISLCDQDKHPCAAQTLDLD